MERALGGAARGRGADASPTSLGEARALRRDRLDLALDLQGDVRASLLLWLTGARAARGLRQHRRRLPAHRRGAPRRDRVVGRAEPPRGGAWRRGRRRRCARRPRRPAHRRRPRLRGGVSRPRRASSTGGPWWASTRAAGGRSSSGRSTAGGRWPRACSASTGATSSSPARRPTGLSRRPLAEGLPEPPVDLTGRLDVRQTLAVIARLRPLPLPRHRAHAPGLRGGHAERVGVRPLRLRCATSRAAPSTAVPSGTWWCATTCGARPATSSAVPPRSATPRSRRSACAW